jgi:hypothetical protein
MSKERSAGAARKGSPSRHRRKFRTGERIRIIDISGNLKDPKYDLKDAESRKMRTAELFRFCLGRSFTIYGFDRYGNIELHVSNSSAVRKKFGKWHWIWVEPQFVERVGDRK